MRLPSTNRGAIDKLKNHFSKVQVSEKDADLDRDPYTSTSWDGDSFSNGATGTINWVTAFGLPEIPKFVWLLIIVRDAGSAGGDYYLGLKAKNTTTNVSIAADAERAANDAYNRTHGCVAVADNGTTHYTVIASGVNTMDIYIFVVAWMK